MTRHNTVLSLTDILFKTDCFLFLNCLPYSNNYADETAWANVYYKECTQENAIHMYYNNTLYCDD
jgi:hypothetical protein